MIRVHEDNDTLELRFIPVISILSSCVLIFMILILLLFPLAQDFDEEFTWYMWAGILGALLLTVLATIALLRRRWGRLVISDKIYYSLKLKDVHLQLPLDTAREIWITGRTSLVDNTLYRLLVETGEGKQGYLYLGEHRFSGKKATDVVSRIMKRLNIPLRDPFSEKHQGSWFMIDRWLASGEDWKFYLLIIVVFFAVALAINLLSQ